MSAESKPKRLRWILLAVALLAGGVSLVYAGSYRFIHAEEALYRVPKDAFGFDKTYVDTRGWGPREFAENPKIARSLVKARGAQALNELGDAVKELGDALEKK